MADTTSARPADLAAYVVAIRARITQIEEEATTARHAFNTFANSPGASAADGRATMGTSTDQLLDRLRGLADYVEIVHDALLLADRSGSDTITVDSATVEGHIADIAVQRGTTYEELMATTTDLTVPLPEVGTIPADSGYVDDPICTATGHLLIPVADFPMPARLELLTWERTYTSVGSLDNVGLGSGWSSWLNARGVRSGPDFVVTDHHCRTIRLAPSTSDGDTWAGTSDERATAWTSTDGNVTASLDDGHVLVRWGRRSPHPYQRWAFDTTTGNITDIFASELGRTEFHYLDGRLVAVAHQGGRRLDLDWDGNRVIAVTSSDGRRVDYHWADDRLVGSTGPGCTERYEYDDAGNIVTIIDADGVVLARSEFDDAGRVTLQHTNYGGTSQFAYEENHRTFVSDADGVRRSGFLHDDKGRVILATGDPLLPLIRRFDDAGRVVEQTNLDGTRFTNDVIVDPADGSSVETLRHTTGSVEVFAYDRHERIVRYERDGSSKSYEYQADDGDVPSMLPIRVSNPHGWFVDFVWNDGLLVRVTDADGVGVDVVCDADGVVVESVDDLGNTTRFEAHSSGAYRRIEHPDGAVEQHEFDDGGHLQRTVDPLGATTVIEMSPAHRLVAITDPLANTTRCIHDADGRLTTITDPSGSACTFEQDVDGRPQQIELPDGSVYQLERDQAGRMIGATANHPGVADERRWTSIRDDAAGSIEMTSPGGRTTALSRASGPIDIAVRTIGDQAIRQEHDHVNHRQIFTDEAGTTWTATFTEDGRQVTSLDPLGSVTTTTYTPAGRLLTVIGDQSTLELSYDPAGRITGRDEGRGRWTYTRDTCGRVIDLTSPMGRSRQWKFDLAGRVVAEQDGTDRTVSTYDLNGRLIGSTTVDGRTTTHRYGPRGELTETVDPSGGVTRYSYDANRRLVTLVDPSGGMTSLTYAFERNVATVTDPLGNVTEHGYDLDGRLISSITSRNGEVSSTVTFQYDAAGRCIAMLHDGEPIDRSGNALIDSVPIGDVSISTVRRDADGLLLSIVSNGFSRTLGRDDSGRVIEVADERNGELTESTLRRDAAGRIVERTVNGSSSNYGYAASGFLESIEGDISAQFEFDPLGRLTSERIDGSDRQFLYDTASQLIEVNDSNGQTRYEYDVLGQRLAGSGARSVAYSWGPQGIESLATSEGIFSFRRDSFGFVDRVTGPQGDVDIVWDHQSLPPVPRSIGGRQLVTDGFTAIGLIGDDGDLVPGARLIEPWGAVTTAEHDDADSATVRWHPFHGLLVADHVVLGARVYDIATRQFVSRDPDVAQIGPAGARWTYCYAHNDPINLFDPLGLSPLSIDEYERIKERYTSVQWGNVAMVVAIVAIAVVAPMVLPALAASAGLTGMGATAFVVVGGGAVTGLGGDLARQGFNNLTNTGNQGFNPAETFKATVLGGLTGPLSRVGPAAGAPVSTMLAAKFGLGAVDSGVGEVYDVLPLPGADGSFDPERLLIGGVTNASVSAVQLRLTPSGTPDIDPVPVRPSAPEPMPALTAGPPPRPALNPAPTRLELAAPVPMPELPAPTIKGNGNSGIYHTPSSQYYNATIAEEMFHSVEQAEAAGFRAPLR